MKSTMLRSRLDQAGIVRVAGAGDALTALLIEKHCFDAVWASGLAISSYHGVPDCSVLPMSEFLSSARIMNDVINLPVIADCDTGFGGADTMKKLVDSYEGAGIAAICIEDKIFPKRNSFLEGHELVDVEEFSLKLRTAKRAQSTRDFMLIARIESFIAGSGVNDAFRRAVAYCDAGADAILIHSKAKTPEEVFDFVDKFRAKGGYRTPLVVLPTTYSPVTCQELEARGIRIVIYANQTLRAAVRAMGDALARIRECGTSQPVEHSMASLQELFDLVKEEPVRVSKAAAGRLRHGRR